MTYRPSDIELAQMAPADAYALGYNRGHDVATSRAVSRADMGLRIEERKSNRSQIDDQLEPIGVE